VDQIDIVHNFGSMSNIGRRIISFTVDEHPVKSNRCPDEHFEHDINRMRISQKRDMRFAKSRTAVSLIRGQLDLAGLRLPG
jgi:hypothetical protein